MKNARDVLDIINAYEATGTYRGAAALTGTTHKTVRRVLDRRAAGAEPGRSAVVRAKRTDAVMELIETRVRETDGRVSAKRLLPAVRARPGSPGRTARCVGRSRRRRRTGADGGGCSARGCPTPAST
jgi:hypothetical protein